MNILYLISLIFFISCESIVLKSNTTIFENKKLFVGVDRINDSLFINLTSINNSTIKLKLIEGRPSYINKNQLDCSKKENRCKDSTQRLDCNRHRHRNYYKAKSAPFKFFEDQHEFYEIHFCYWEKDNGINGINLNSIFRVLEDNLIKFTAKIDLDYSKFNFFKNKTNNVISNYHSLKITLNPVISKKQKLVDHSNFLVNVDFKQLLVKDLEFDRIDYIVDLFETFDFRIRTNNRNLNDLSENLEKRITMSGNLEIKNKNKQIFYSKDFKELMIFKDNKLTQKKVIISKYVENSIQIGMNFIKDNYDLYLKFEKGKREEIVLYEKYPLFSLIMVIVLSLVVVGLIVGLVFAIVKLKN